MQILSYFIVPRSLGVPTRVACLHTSTPILAQAGGSTASRKRNPLALKKENRQLKAERAERDAARKPHVILGTVPGDTTSWPKSDLAQILVDLKPSDAKETADPAELDTALGPLQLPPALRFGVTDREQTLLLETLPSLSTELGTDDILSQSSSDHAPSYTYGGFFSELETKTPREARLNKEKMSAQSAEDEARRYAAELEAGKKELQKAQMFTTLLDLRNSDAQGLAFENRRRIVQEFSGPENPFDTGRPEVQGQSRLNTLLDV